jgi:hypothetical protein
MTRSIPAALASLVLATGCITVHTPAYLQGSGDREWPSTLSQARRLAATGEPYAADSLLMRFEARHPSSSKAIETAYWRALIRLDPQYGSAGAADALPLLDRYLAGGGKREHREEASALMRVADLVNRLNTQLTATTARANMSGGTSPPAATSLSAAEAESEVRKLKEGLAKANDELERIKKRLAELQKKGGG